jgi:hypothetical protein
VVVTLREITDGNRVAVLALRVAPEQERFVSSVQAALADAAEYPHAMPWYRAVYASDDPVGFVFTHLPGRTRAAVLPSARAEASAARVRPGLSPPYHPARLTEHGGTIG